MKTNFRFVITMLSLVLCFSAVAFGQRTTGDIEGTITDPQGAVVPNVTVTIVSAQSAGAGSEANVTTGFRRTVTTDSNGFFRVQQVPPGSYLVTTAPISGFGEGRLPNVRVSVDTTTRADIQLSVAGTVGTVNVSADDAPPIDVGGTKVQTNITSQRIELLPKGVDFTSVLRTVPGVRPESLAGGFSIDGASGSENTFYIDGQEVTNFRTGTLNGNNAIPTQFVQEVQVKSSGFEAEFGGATGGVVSVVTKGGSNDFHGEFGVAFNTQKLNGGPRPSLFRFTNGSGASFVQRAEYIKPPKAGGTDFFPTANMSGPIVKNKLWFFGSYTPQIFTQDVTTDFYTNASATQLGTAAPRAYRFSQNYKATTRYEYAFLRLDAQPTQTLRLTGSFLWNPLIQDGVIPFGTVSLGGVEAAIQENGQICTSSSTNCLRGADLYSRQGGRQTANNVRFEAAWTPTSKFVATGRYSRGFLNQKLGNYTPFLATSYRCIVGGSYCPTGESDPSPSVTDYDVSVRTNIEGDATYFATIAGVRNEIKGGYQWFRIRNDVNAGYINRGIIRIWMGYTIQDIGASSTPDPNAIGAGELIRFGTRGSGENTNQSLYIQDRLQFGSRVTFNVGVRAEKEDLPSFNNLAPPINFGLGDKIAPRLGVSIGLNKSGTAKAWASYGKFYDRLKFELPRGSFGGDFYRWDYFEIFPTSPNWRTFTIPQIIGSWNDAPGGRCPNTGFIAPGALSRCQFDYRIASNDPNATIYTGAVDPNLKPFQQDEVTVGYQQQFFRNYVFGARFTWKDVKWAIEDAGILTPEFSEAYIIGNPGSGLHAQVLRQLGYTKSVEPQRNYKAFELSLDRRLANNFYFNVNYTWSRLFGNYSGLASSDENGRTSPGVNRFFDLPYIGFTYKGQPDNGLLATDRTHVVNSYGAYTFDWLGSKTNSTDFGYFTTFQSGTPQTTLVSFHSSGTPIPLNGRGDMGRTPMFTQTDVNVSHKYRFGRDNRFTLAGDLNIINLFNEANVTSRFTTLSAVAVTEAALGFSNPVAATNALTSGQLYNAVQTYLNGAPNRKDGRYGLSNGYQGPRSVRFGFRLLF
ncbi:MAG: carboxypeptidase regulatory-like domain-containing protein [Pyrinomonadaceae bacterium]